MIMLMVYDKDCNTFTQNYYDNKINSVNFSSLTCTCNHKGSFIIHGYYKRNVRYKGNIYTITILRLRCTQCGHTHAVLLSSMVPYSQIPLDDQIRIITDYESKKNFMSAADGNPLIDPREIYYIIKKYTKYWKQRLLSQFLSISGTITQECYQFFSMQFMQIKYRLGKLFITTT